jgi:hypothetical protein
MLITDENKLDIVRKLKVHSSKISELEIYAWEKYDHTIASDFFWPNQYLKLYIQVLEDSVSEGVELSEADVNRIVESCKEIVSYTLKEEL